MIRNRLYQMRFQNIFISVFTKQSHKTTCNLYKQTLLITERLAGAFDNEFKLNSYM